MWGDGLSQLGIMILLRLKVSRSGDLCLGNDMDSLLNNENFTCLEMKLAVDTYLKGQYIQHIHLSTEVKGLTPSKARSFQVHGLNVNI